MADAHTQVREVIVHFTDDAATIGELMEAMSGFKNRSWQMVMNPMPAIDAATAAFAEEMELKKGMHIASHVAHTGTVGVREVT